MAFKCLALIDTYTHTHLQTGIADTVMQPLFLVVIKQFNICTEIEETRIICIFNSLT